MRSSHGEGKWRRRTVMKVDHSHCYEMGLVEACNGDWVMEHLKEQDIIFLAKFCNIFHTFCTCVLLMYCVKSMYCIISCSLWASRMNFCLYLLPLPMHFTTLCLWWLHSRFLQNPCQSDIWCLTTTRRNSYQPVLVRMYHNCAIVEAWLPLMTCRICILRTLTCQAEA